MYDQSVSLKKRLVQKQSCLKLLTELQEIMPEYRVRTLHKNIIISTIPNVYVLTLFIISL